jgi:hypothetical protein
MTVLISVKFKKTLHISTYNGLLCHFATHITAVPLQAFRVSQIIYFIAPTEGVSDITLFLLGLRKAHCNSTHKAIK